MNIISRVENSISPLENNIQIFAPSCNILYIFPLDKTCIEITAWLASAYDLYARVVKDC